MEIILNKSENNILVVDGDHLAHRAFYAHSRPDNALRTKTGIYSGCFYGFFAMLVERIATYGIEEVIVCWGDSRENLFRRTIYPEYKAGRHVMPDYYREQEYDIKLALSGMGFKQYSARTYEGDDVIAAVVAKHVARMRAQYAESMARIRNIFILSGDKDMLQLVSDNIFVVSNTTSSGVRDTVYNRDKVFEKYGIFPEMFSDYLTLIGDTADNIPGVRGIGPKTAVQLLVQYGPIKSWFNRIETLDITKKQRDLLLANRETMVVSKRLINLKSMTEQTVPLELLTFPEVVSLTAEQIFDKYEMVKIRPYSLLRLDA